MAAQSFNHYHPSQTAMFSCLDYSLSASVHASYSLYSIKKAGSSFKNLSDDVISLVRFPASLLLKSKLFTVFYKVLYYLYPTYYLSDHKTFYLVYLTPATLTVCCSSHMSGTFSTVWFFLLT